MSRMLAGYWTTQALHVVAKLGVVEHLRDGPRSAEELAGLVGAHPGALYRLLRALASVGVFAEDDRRFALTPLSDCLRGDRPDSQRAMALAAGEMFYAAWGELLYSVRTGKSAFTKLHGRPIFDYLADHPDQGRLFDETMVAVHGAETAAMLAAYDFSDVRVLADVGGGNGSVLTAVLRRYANLQGILFDLPNVADRARAAVEAAGLAGRCRVVGGSFFDGVPEGADAYLLRHIIHDWDDEQAAPILANVRRALGPGGRLLVAEFVIPPGAAQPYAKFLDLAMLVLPGGRERTEDEYRALYRAAGFRLTRVVPTAAEVSVIEGVKA